jgi:hypothetical protein
MRSADSTLSDQPQESGKVKPVVHQALIRDRHQLYVLQPRLATAATAVQFARAAYL